jgi:diguanylate cyclase (GGDEF)-like protein
MPIGALDPDKVLTQYGHDAWTDRAGLPQNSIQAVIQTRDGYIWMATQEGLVRFDGMRFTVYDRSNVPAMGSQNVLCLCQDREGVLWCGLESGGVLRLKDGAFSAVGLPPGLSGDKVLCLLAGRDGRLWLGTSSGGLVLQEEGRLTLFGPRQGLEGQATYSLMEDRAGTLWAGTNRGVFRGTQGAFQKVEIGGRERNWFYCFAEDAAGTVWVGTFRGLYAVSPGSVRLYRVKDGLCDDQVMALHFEPGSGCLWVGTNRGLNRLQGDRFQAFSEKEGLSNGSVVSLASDAEGSLWIGTSGGLNRLRDTKFYSVTTREGLLGDVVFTVCETPDGSLWIGGEGGGVSRVTGGQTTHYPPGHGLPPGPVDSVMPGLDGSPWVGMDVGGLMRLRGSRFEPFLPTEPALVNSTVTCLLPVGQNDIWVGAASGLFRIESGKITRFGSKEGFGEATPNCILALAGGDLAVGTDGGGLAILRNGKFAFLTEKDGLASNIIYALFDDGAGSLWMGTPKGLCRLRNGRTATVTTRQGLFDDCAYALLDDDQGYLWMSCNKGVYRVLKADLEAVADGRAATVTCSSYGRADGMGTNECNGGQQPCAWKTRDGRLCFATMRGVAILDPSSIRVNPRPPPVVIEEALLDGKLVHPGGARFAPGKHRLEIHFSALSLVAPEKVLFKYQMEGFDTNWVEGGTNREAVYTGLPPGAYRFRVVACNNDGVWNLTGATYDFEQAPRFYQTSWFVALSVLAVTLLIGATGALRVRGLKRRQAILERQVDERTAELGLANRSLRERGMELEDANRKLERLSREDGLTGVSNRRHFEEMLEAEWRRASRTRSPLSVVMIDIDEFKPYNDTLGHQAGDECLRRVATALASVLHRAGDLLARYGGDEFVAVLPVTDQASALAMADCLRKKVEELGIPGPSGQRDKALTVSVGVSTAFPGEEGGGERLLAAADKALYLAKGQGRNRVCSA